MFISSYMGLIAPTKNFRTKLGHLTPSDTNNVNIIYCHSFMDIIHNLIVVFDFFIMIWISHLELLNQQLQQYLIWMKFWRLVEVLTCSSVDLFPRWLDQGFSTWNKNIICILHSSYPLMELMCNYAGDMNVEFDRHVASVELENWIWDWIHCI